MTFRTFALVALSALSVAAGCSAGSNPTSAESDYTEGQSTNATLQQQTFVKGDVAVGTTTVHYEPSVDYAKVDGIPYLAWKLTDATARTANGAITIDVEGNFPGSPDVLVVDANFNVVGQAQGAASSAGAKASLVVDAAKDPAMILVRDEIWVIAMQFDITVSQ